MDELLLKWKEVLALVQAEVNPISFDTFIADLTPIELKGNELIIRNPISYAQTPLEQNYFSIFADALFKVYGFPVAPVFMTESDAENYQKLKPKVFVPENETDFGLLPSLTFDTFVVGSSNRMAHAASLATADLPGKAYNPLYLYGHSGLGKTHLMHAIGNYALGRNPFSKILYVTSEAFTIELIDAIRTNTTQKFRDKYRNIDILMIDDIISYGGSLYHSANKLKELGVGKIYAYATHTENSVLDREKGTLIKSLENGTVEKLFTTNSLYSGKHEKIEVVNI
jgi:chromosomal replication initiator protein